MRLQTQAKSQPSPAIVEIRCESHQTVAVWFAELASRAPKRKFRRVLVKVVASALRHSGQHSDGQVQLGQCGDLEVGLISYHIATEPTVLRVQACKRDIRVQKVPVMLVPQRHRRLAQKFARQAKIGEKLSIFGLEDFLCHLIVFSAIEQNCEIFQVWRSIISDYNNGIHNTSLPSISLRTK